MRKNQCKLLIGKIRNWIAARFHWSKYCGKIITFRKQLGRKRLIWKPSTLINLDCSVFCFVCEHGSAASVFTILYEVALHQSVFVLYLFGYQIKSIHLNFVLVHVWLFYRVFFLPFFTLTFATFMAQEGKTARKSTLSTQWVREMREGHCLLAGNGKMGAPLHLGHGYW